MSFKEFQERLRRGPTDVTGLDFGRYAIKAVRLRKTGDDSILLVGAELLPSQIGMAGAPPFAVSPRLRARNAAIAISGNSSVTRLLTFPGAIDASFEAQLAKNLGLQPDTTDRMAYRVISEGAGRNESRVLAVSVSEAEAASAMHFFATGLPAPCSLEVAPVAALTAFETGPVLSSSEPVVGLIDFGTSISTLSIFYKKSLVLIRRFDFGVIKLIERVTSTLHVDADTALNILSDPAFDISEPVAEIMGPFSSQLVVSRDFIERRENCSLKKLYIIGGIAASHAAIHELERSLNLGIQLWNPFSIPGLRADGLDPSLEDHQGRFAAAIGAALGALQEKP